MLSPLFQGIHQSYRQIQPHWKYFVLKLLACYPLLEYLDSVRFSFSLSLPPTTYTDTKRKPENLLSSTHYLFLIRLLKLLISIFKLSYCLQVSIPLGMHNNLPVSISLLARHGSDAFLLNLVETLYDTIKEEAGIAETMSN